VPIAPKYTQQIFHLEFLLKKANPIKAAPESANTNAENGKKSL